MRHIGEDADWLLNMVENLLTVTRIQNGTASVNKSLEPVEEVMLEAIQRIRKRLPEIRVNVRLPEEFVMIPMDPLLIEQVLINLMENAFYHGHSDKSIELSTRKEEDEVLFFVKDYGRGFQRSVWKQFLTGKDRTGAESRTVTEGWGLDFPYARR